MKQVFAGRSLLMAAACLVIFCGCVHTDHPGPVLEISQFPEGPVLMQVELGKEAGFSLSFIHSVSMTPVTDIYRVENGRIIQTAERFRTHGKGLPSQVNEPYGTGWKNKGDEFVFTMARPIPKMVIRTDKNYKNRLMIGDRTINLNQWEDQALLLRIYKK